jgi:hypothetical protein
LDGFFQFAYPAYLFGCGVAAFSAGGKADFFFFLAADKAGPALFLKTFVKGDFFARLGPFQTVHKVLVHVKTCPVTVRTGIHIVLDIA